MWSPLTKLVTLMNRMRGALALLAGGIGRGHREDRLAEEIRFHIEMATEQNLERGMNRRDARRAAELQFGGGEMWREEARDEYRSRRLDELAKDARFAVRTLRSAPAFAIAAVLTLAIGIGANTAIFSAVNG